MKENTVILRASRRAMPRVHANAWRLLLLFLLAGINAHLVGQATKGAVSGVVTDPQGGALQGARAEVKGEGLSAVSDAQGQFSIPDVPAGSHTITVTYLGFSDFSADVAVKAGAITQMTATLSIAGENQSVEVRADRQRGEIEALNRERTADNIVQVLPSEVILSLPNTNIADALGRSPSVSLERDEGEGKYVQIRGTEPRLTNFTINGVHVSSPENNVRNVKLDVIPATLVESIEINKTLSANQDGDAIGGSVNLVTRTADKKPFYNIGGVYGYSPIVNGRSLEEIDGTGAKRFKAEKLGVVLGGSFDYNGRGYNNIEPSPAVWDYGQGNVAIFNGIHIREYAQRRTRYGFAGGSDYRINDAATIWVKGLFSEFLDFGDTWNVQPTPADPATPSSFGDGGKVVLRHLDRTPQQQIFSVVAGHSLSRPKSLLNVSMAVSRSSQAGQFPSTFFSSPSNITFGLDMSNQRAPQFPVLNGVNIYDPSIYSMTKTQLANDHTRELDLEGAASLTRYYVRGSHSGLFEFGGKIRSGDKKNITDEPVLVATGDSRLQYSDVLGNLKDPNFYFGEYKLPPLSDYKKIKALIAANPGALTLDVDQTRARSDPNNYNATERVYALYAMNTISFGRARLQTGVRVETTQSNFTGYKVSFGSTADANGFFYQSTTPVKGSNLYADVLPSVQFQYAITPDTNLRASYGRGIARPNFSDLPPYVVEDSSNQTVSIGNPALKPTSADNFDLLLEKYLKPYGILQAGFFYKRLSDPIVPENITLSSTDRLYPGFVQTQPVNIPNAYILGIEASLQQRLTYLPGLMGGLGVAANYSYTTSQSSFPADYGRTDHPALVRQGPNNWNTDVTYDKSRLSGRFGVTHNDAYIYQYIYLDGAALGLSGPNGDNYTYAHTQLDAQANVRLKGDLKFVASFLNMTNEVFGFYLGSPKYPNQREFYGPTYSFGLRWSSRE